MIKTGTTTTDLNLRSGPGTDFAVLTVLPPRTQWEVFEESLGDQGYDTFVRLRSPQTDPPA